MWVCLSRAGLRFKSCTVMFKNILLLLSLLFFALSCSGPSQDIPLEVNLTTQEIEKYKYDIIRYAGKLAPRATEQTKFSPAFDEYYRELSQKHDLKALHKTGNREYFLLTRIAPSIHLKKVAVGGFLEKNEEGRLSHYEEVFRTFKMEEEELVKKSRILFNLMIKGKDLSPYYFENSKGEEYVEFPNGNVIFNPQNRKWETIEKTPVEELRNLNLH